MLEGFNIHLGPVAMLVLLLLATAYAAWFIGNKRGARFGYENGIIVGYQHGVAWFNHVIGHALQNDAELAENVKSKIDAYLSDENNRNHVNGLDGGAH